MILAALIIRLSYITSFGLQASKPPITMPLESLKLDRILGLTTLSGATLSSNPYHVTQRDLLREDLKDIFGTPHITAKGNSINAVKIK